MSQKFRNGQYWVVLASLLWLCACTRTAVNTSRVKEVPASQTKPSHETWPCPNVEDARASSASVDKIIDQAESFVANAAKGGMSAEQLKACKQRNDDWKRANQALVNHCIMLLGQDGTPVHPEIPEALQVLNGAGHCVENSLDAVSSHDTTTAQAYITRARSATDNANKLLDGTLKPFSRVSTGEKKDIGQSGHSSTN